ncbi:MAG TPA: AraC family transcriptional regulator [Candidatus Limnocylindrales bacterium]|nr:AraC family transcriptional regulator [Candidatus Limnocylindrales bacterium]
MSAFPFDFRMRVLEGPLSRAVASAWYARGTIPYRREKVAPTGSTVAVIVLGDPIIETPGGPHAVPVRTDTGFLIGPHDRPVTNEPTGETFAVGIVTTPVGCRAALGIEPAPLAGDVVALLPAWAPGRALRETLAAEADPEAMLDLVMAHLEGALDLAVPGLDRCEAAVAMLEADPARPIADIAAEAGVSHGHLDREFTRLVGLSPRRLARLLRVERLLAAVDPAGEPRWADLAATLGWTDQSHLIRDVKRHTGVTPSQYLAARRSFATDEAYPEAARFVPEPM